MPIFSQRSTAPELMDDYAINDSRLSSALNELRWVNRYLGGYSATMSVLAPFLRCRAGRKTCLLDLGTGGADFPVYLVKWAQSQNPPIDIEIVAIDSNPATVAYSGKTVDRCLPPQLRSKIRIEMANALALPYSEKSFEVVSAAMFMHHLNKTQTVQLLCEASRLARAGILINDLHRHPVAYLSIWILTRILRASEMVRNDAPLSVLRGFRRREVVDIARAAGLVSFHISWHWAFRWILTTIKT